MEFAARWFDADRSPVSSSESLDWPRVVPFVGLHLGAVAVLWVGVSEIAMLAAAVSYFVRMFAITAFYHRYFAHKTFKAGRLAQFIFAVAGASATQRGPLWWSGQHRQHHRHADTSGDPHDARRGWLWSHVGWFLSKRHFHAPEENVRDWRRFPELVWLDRFDWVVPAVYAGCMYLLGAALTELGTNGWQMLVWGYIVSTLVLVHVTLLVNSLGHRVGTRRYETSDSSRNCWWLALLTLGEGWHNNHHRYAGSARQGFVWWEVDISYYLLRMLALTGCVREVRTVPKAIVAQRRS